MTRDDLKKHIDDARAQFTAAMTVAHQNATKALDDVKTKIGDQDGDGDVDFRDAGILAQKEIDKAGWGWGESAILGAGAILGALAIKLGPILLKLVF